MRRGTTWRNEPPRFVKKTFFKEFFVLFHSKQKRVFMNWDSELKKKVKKAGDSGLGQFFLRLSSRIGGIPILSAIHIGFVALVGFITSYPLFLAGGFWLALPTTAFTILIAGIVFFCLFSYSFRLFIGNHWLHKTLVFAMLFSLPFSLLSLPLLHGLSQQQVP
jgi:hypothetical protein